jgi:general secretion pathway protein L
LSASTEQLENLEARFTSAVAIALEGLKKPRNPATNLLKGDFAKQNKGLQTLWENWGTLIQIGAASLVVLFVWSYLRNSFSQTLADKGTEAVAEQAKSVARLPKKQANETGVRKYIKENKRKISEMKAISSVAQMNSALDLLKKVSEAAPGRSQVKVDIVRFNVRDDVVQIMGYANSAQDVLALSQGLKSLSLDGTVTNQPAGLGVMPNKTSFNLSFRTDRGIVK